MSSISIRYENNLLVKGLTVFFVIVGIAVVCLLGIVLYHIYSINKEKELLETNTRTYLLQSRSYGNEEIQSIEAVSVTKGWVGPFEVRVIFKDEPNNIYYYEDDDGIFQKKKSYMSKENYIHLE